MEAEKRVASLRGLMVDRGLDAYILRDPSDLMWLTGFERVFDSETAHTAIVTSDRCIIHTDSRYSTAMRTAAGFEGLWEVEDSTRGVKAFLQLAREKWLNSGGAIAFDDSTPVSLYRIYQEALDDCQLVERSCDIVGLRSVKGPVEITRIKAAQSVAEKAFWETLDKMHVGMTERQVSLILEFAMRSAGADELAFANIVASGPNSANPHAVPGDRVLQAGDLVVIDFGARVDGYRSDTTRTVCMGAPDSEQQRIYDAVQAANEAVEGKLRAGVTGVQMHQLAEDILAQHGYEGRMGHGLGHGVGIDIHESPNLNLRNDKPIAVGSIVTVEPGVYIPGENGVRLEDFGLVTETSFENFCTLPHELIRVE